MIVNCSAARSPLKDKSIHCGVTSPPYYGLRLYAGLEPQVWGGVDGCEHEWGESPIFKVGRSDGGRDIGGRGGNYKSDGPHQVEATSGQFCRRCGAWRGHLGNEPTPEQFIAHLVEVGREMWRVLRDDGVWFLNLGDSYVSNPGNGRGGERVEGGTPHRSGMNKSGGKLKDKNKMLIPHRAALALQAAGWTLRQDMPWLKMNPMPESVADRPSTAHEYIFILTKSSRVYWDGEAVKRASTEQTGQAANFSRGNGKVYEAETVPGQGYAQHREGRESTPSPTRQFRTTDPWLDSLDLTIAQTQAQLAHLRAIRDAGGLLEADGEPTALFTALKGFSGAHFATFPLALVLPLIKAATSEAGCCPVCGSQWVRVVQKPDFSQQPKRTANKLEGEMISKGTQYMTSAGQAWQEWRNQNPDITTGWRPSCSCPPHNPIPALVLDPFCGSGTVGEACRKLGRRFIGLDLSAEYLAKNAAARAEQMTTGAGLEVARQRRPKGDKRAAKMVKAGQIGLAL